MQVIEALSIGVEEPHDYLHIKHERSFPAIALAGTLVQLASCRLRGRPHSSRLTNTRAPTVHREADVEHRTVLSRLRPLLDHDRISWQREDRYVGICTQA
jgi:hypothetical protein